jgi:hypothetical protein
MFLGFGEFFILLLLLFGTVFWLFGLIHIASRKRDKEQKIWLIFVALTHAPGALVYFVWEQINQRKI